MDTKSKSMTEISARKLTIRAFCAAVTFFLGVSLTLGSLSSMLGRWAAGRDPEQWYVSDWQQTPAFRESVATYLEAFLTLGAGGELDWYYDQTAYIYGTASERPRSSFRMDTVMTTESTPVAVYPADYGDAPDLDYCNQKNILYRILVDGKAKYASTELGDDILTDLDNAPEGFNFVLHFTDGTVAAMKDGIDVDIYGDGVYDSNSQWYVPGYENFQAGTDVENVEVLLAVRKTPIRFVDGRYAVNSRHDGDSVYWGYQQWLQSRTVWLELSYTLGAGILLLAGYFLLRRNRVTADRKIAELSKHVCTELRALSVIISLLIVAIPVVLYLISYGWDSYGTTCENLLYLLRSLCTGLENTGGVLWLWWSVWLIRNDHRYNVKDTRWSALRKLGNAVHKHELRYPLQKRLYRSARLQMLLPLLLGIIAFTGTLLIYLLEYDLHPAHLVLWIAIGAFLVIAEILWLRREHTLAHDFGRLADQVAAVQHGEIDTTLDLPVDSDLRETAERLNDIQVGLNAAVAEQIRSERMKVELITNVSHDLKTPLTSILSYSELLRREPLDVPAKEYAAIIEQKAQRLKTMVQDVFDISKAASDQLPVNQERLDFAKLLRQTLADMDERIQKSTLCFRVSLPEQPVEIKADGQRLYRVFQNLIQNVLQYSLSGSRVYLTLSASETSAEAVLRNTSQTELPAGIDLSARFVRGDESRTDGGSGLGLSIAKSFTEACGGSFCLETVADLFTVRVTFPLFQ